MSKHHRIALFEFPHLFESYENEGNNWKVKSIYNRIENGGIHLKSSQGPLLPEALVF